MTQPGLKKLEIVKPKKIDGLYHFMAYQEDIEAFKAVAGKKAAEYMRQAMRQITQQLSENEAQAS